MRKQIYTLGTRRSIVVCSLFFHIGLLFGGPNAEGQPRPFPALGSPVPAYVLNARIKGQVCLTDVDHRDPCSSIRIHHTLFTVAWDRHTKLVTYMMTMDSHLVTDSELGVGGGGRLVGEGDQPYQLTKYLDWLVTPMWADTVQDWTRDAVWYAGLRRDP